MMSARGAAGIAAVKPQFKSGDSAGKELIVDCMSDHSVTVAACAQGEEEGRDLSEARGADTPKKRINSCCRSA